MTETKPNCCCDCGATRETETLAYRGPDLLCQGCDDDRERAWVAEAPDERRHYIDTFNPA